MKSLFVSIFVVVLLVGCGEGQQSSSPDTQPSETDEVKLTPPLSPAAEDTSTDLVAETPVQLDSELKSDEPVTPTINPEPEWKKATEGNWDVATRGNTAQIRQLIAEGMAVDAPDKEGMTALYRAAHNDQKETVSLLLGKGANVNIRDKWGNTPLDVTLNDTVADLLRKHGGKTGEELKAEGK
tara:strand:+ start:542 stop:1090 length:549 start_codon:yes stop_codon:yes gene_type:complete